MNDFSRSSELLFSILFADDTSAFIGETNFENISKILNTELEKVNMWLKANKLTINTKKTHYMMFHRTQIKHNTNMKILNDFTFIYPYLIYCIEVWGNAQHTHLDSLIKIQKKVSKQ